MERLVVVGYPFTMLNKQYRMHSDILIPANRIFYENKLTSASGLDDRVGVREFSRLSHLILERRIHNALWFDIPTGFDLDSSCKSKYHVKIGPQRSKSCEYQAIQGTKLATLLIDTLRKVKPQGRVGVLTNYADQKNLYLKAKQNMQTAGYEG